MLTDRHVADIKAAASLLASAAPGRQLIGDKGYDADHLRLFLHTRGTIPVIPNKTNRKRLFPFNAGLYRPRQRANVLPLEGFSSYRNPLRQNRPQLSRRPVPRDRPLLLDQLNLDPSADATLA
jgi:hypothetical protein